MTARLKKPSLTQTTSTLSFPFRTTLFYQKIIERVVVKQFIHHADQNGLPPSGSQLTDDFIPCTESAVLVVHNDIVRAIDDGHVAALALLDLNSAFRLC